MAAGESLTAPPPAPFSPQFTPLSVGGGGRRGGPKCCGGCGERCRSALPQAESPGWERRADEGGEGWPGRKTLVQSGAGALRQAQHERVFVISAKPELCDHEQMSRSARPAQAAAGKRRLPARAPCAGRNGKARMDSSAQAGGAAAQSKWGRHFCRPHSHRCVVCSEEPNLASDVSPSFRTGARMSGSVTGARTGIRIHPPAKSSRAIGAEAVSSRSVSTFNRRLRGRIAHAGPSSGRASSGSKAIRYAPIGRRPCYPARNETTSHFLHRAIRIRPKPSARSRSRCTRTGFATPSRFGIIQGISSG